MEINGNNVFKKGSIIPIQFAIEGLAPDTDVTSSASKLSVDLYAVDEYKGVFADAKKITLSLEEDSENFKQIEGEYSTFAVAVDTARIDAGRIAGEVSFTFFDDTTGLQASPIIPFLTDYIVKEW